MAVYYHILYFLGIPVSQQHLLYNHKELSDATEMKDIPLVSKLINFLVISINFLTIYLISSGQWVPIKISVGYERGSYLVKEDCNNF